MLAGELSEAFRDEHREMRDILLGLMEAIENNDVESFHRKVDEMMAHAGPHFHYEQEALYPALADIHGEDYVERLRAEHDAALEAIEELAELAEAEQLGEEETEYGRDLVRQLLPHVSDRGGLAMIMEVLPEESIKSILEVREESKRSGKSVLELAKGRKKRGPTPRRRSGKAHKMSPAARAKSGRRKTVTKPAVPRKKTVSGRRALRGAARKRTPK
jgi:Hemerythrin HHE cation binding domain